jgi:TolB-like protein
MPFDSLPEHSEHVYLVRGIVADLTTDLSRLAGLRVIGAAKVAGQATSTIPQAHPEARYVVSGSVQRAAEHLKLNVHLTDSETGQQLWSERYERPLRDPFTIQEEIVARLVAALRVEVTEAERRRFARRHTRNLEAYDYFVRAQAALLTRQRADNEKARELYRQALRMDPSFARAHAGLALTYAADYRNRWTEQAPQALARAAELAETAFGINPDILEVHWALAYVHAQGCRHEQAMAHLQRPSRWTAHSPTPTPCLAASTPSSASRKKPYRCCAPRSSSIQMPVICASSIWGAHTFSSKMPTRRPSTCARRCGAMPKISKHTSIWRRRLCSPAIATPPRGKPRRSVPWSRVSPPEDGSKHIR